MYSPVLLVPVLYLQVSLVMTEEPARSHHAKDLGESAGTSASQKTEGSHPWKMLYKEDTI